MVDANYFHDVCKFHRLMGFEYNGPPKTLDGYLPTTIVRFLHELEKEVEDHCEGEIKLRLALIFEELREYVQALLANDLEKMFDALLDLTYVVVGTADHHGFPFNPGWERVHGANLGKAGGPRRADGKQLKPEGWQPPVLRDLLEQFGAQLPVEVEVLNAEIVIDASPDPDGDFDIEESEVEDDDDEEGGPAGGLYQL